jgi:hypothetical protein
MLAAVASFRLLCPKTAYGLSSAPERTSFLPVTLFNGEIMLN